MKKSILSLMILSFLALGAQGLQKGGWIISHNNQQKLKANREDLQKNVIQIKRSDLKKSGQLFVNYNLDNQKGWNRTISLFDSQDNELLKHSGALLKVGNSKLNALANRIDTFFIYTMALPSDPAVAATVRVRRVHLATVVLKK